MRILILHFRSAPHTQGKANASHISATDSAGTDGVSLEMKKRQALLEEMGHQVSICSAYPWADIPVPDLEFDSEPVRQMIRHLFEPRNEDSPAEHEVQESFQEAVEELMAELRAGFDKIQPDVLFVHNVFALPVHPVATVALKNLLQERGLPCVAIHHDVLSEGAYKFQPSSEFSQTILDDYFPPKLPNIYHWTINTRNQKALADRGIEASVIYDSMDFGHVLKADEYQTLRIEIRKKHGIQSSDVVLFMGARIVPNKQIELAGHITHQLNQLREDLVGKTLYNGEVFSPESRIILILAGRPERAFAEYEKSLFSLLNDLKIGWKYVGDTVFPIRDPENGLYALYPDMYAIADFVLYPSRWEGFGNQLLEAFAGGLPTVVFEYPVFKEDIAPKGVKVISLGDQAQTDDTKGLVTIPENTLQRVASEMISLLTDKNAHEAVAKQNRKIGMRHFDFQILRSHLKQGVEWASGSMIQ